MMENYFYQLLDGRVWSALQVGWVENLDTIDGPITKVNSLDALREVLRFYHYDLGELATIEDKKPGDEYELIEGRWVKVRFTRKEFLLWVGLNVVVAINGIISNTGNPLLKTLLELVQASEYVDVQDPDTIQLVQMLTTSDAGAVLSEADAVRILAGQVWVENA